MLIGMLALLEPACTDPALWRASSRRTIQIDGRTLHGFSSTRIAVGTLDVFIPPGDHPTTADITVGVIRSHLPVQQLVRQLESAHEAAIRQDFATVPFKTGDAVRFQSCKVYLDRIGQPAMALEVAERMTSESSAATGVVWELDNLEQARDGYRLCRRARDRLGEVWVLHRSFFSLDS